MWNWKYAAFGALVFGLCMALITWLAGFSAVTIIVLAIIWALVGMVLANFRGLSSYSG